MTTHQKRNMPDVSDKEFTLRIEQNLNTRTNYHIEDILQKFIEKNSDAGFVIDELLHYYAAGAQKLYGDSEMDRSIAAGKHFLEWYPESREERVRIQKQLGLRVSPTWELQLVPADWGTYPEDEVRYALQEREKQQEIQKKQDKERLERLQIDAQLLRQEIGTPQTEEDIERIIFLATIRKSAALLLPASLVSAYRTSLKTELQASFDAQTMFDQYEETCDTLYRERSIRETVRLGYPNTNLAFQHQPQLHLVETVQGQSAGRELAKRFGFTPQDPESMWEVMQTRKDGDAVIAFVGDDRGYEENWQYYICVCWYPQRFLYLDPNAGKAYHFPCALA